VREAETRCPFCGAAFAAPPRPTRVLSARIGRGALLAFGLATVTGAALDLEACSTGAYGGPRPDIGPRHDVGADATARDASDHDADGREDADPTDGAADTR
jgi:hypothetical protein